MKKLLSVLVASLLILSLCSCEKTANDIVETDAPVLSENVKKHSEPPEEVLAENAQTTENAEILEELKGFYITKKFVDTYKETKSLLKAAENEICMLVRDDNDEKTIFMLGDLHQGGPVFGDIDSVTFENGKYILKTLPTSDAYAGILEMAYTPDSNVVQISVYGSLLWDDYYSSDAPQEFYRYDDTDDVINDINGAMLDGISNVEFKGDDAYIEVDGNEYIIEFPIDPVVGEPVDFMKNYDGYLYIKPVDTYQIIVGQYSYDDGKITIASEKVNLVLE